LSYQTGQFINDFIDPKKCSVTYTSFDEAIFMIQDLCKKEFVFKVDIKSAFRLLPIHPRDFELLGFTLDGMFF